MHYLRFIVILTLYFLPALAASGQDDRDFVEPPKHGEFVGAKPRAYETTGVRNKGKSRARYHPGIVVGGPLKNNEYQVAMISSKLPHDPPQQPIKDFHPGADTYGNIDLSPAKVIKMKNMRIWVNEKTRQQEQPLTPDNLQKLREAMVPHAGWKAPKAASESEDEPAQKASNQKGTTDHVGNQQANPAYPQGPRPKNSFPPSTVQGGSATNLRPEGKFGRPLPAIPASQYYASGSRGPYPGSRVHDPLSNVASSSKHKITSGSSQYGSQAGNRQGPLISGRPNSPSKRPNSPSTQWRQNPPTFKRPNSPSKRPNLLSKRPNSPSKRPNSPPKRPNSPSKRPNSPLNRPNQPLARPDASSKKRPYPPPKPHIPSGLSGPSSKRPGSPSDRSRASGPRIQTQNTGKGKGREERSPPRKSRSPSPPPRPRNNNKGKNRERSPSRKPKFN